MSKLVDSLLVALTDNAPWVALTGAGISHASGIPTYRDHSGRWLGSQPIQHQDFIDEPAARRRYWSRSVFGWPRVAAALPNATHYALAQLESAGVLSGIITQNVDRLHQKAGSHNVVDLHGRLDQVKCLDCGAMETRQNIQQMLVASNNLPTPETLTLRPDGDADLPSDVIEDFAVPECKHCGGVVMPDVVFFGGSVPQSRAQECYDLIDASRGMLVIGSSLSVYSGFRFCRYLVGQDKPLLILNQGDTRADDICTQKYDSEPFSLLTECAALLAQKLAEVAHD